MTCMQPGGLDWLTIIGFLVAGACFGWGMGDIYYGRK